MRCLVRAGIRHSLKTFHRTGDEWEGEMSGKVVGVAKQELWSLVENAGRIFLRTDVVWSHCSLVRSLWFLVMVTSSVIVLTLLVFFFPPQTYLWKSYRMALTSPLCHQKYDTRRIEKNYFFSPDFTASWHKFSPEMVKISAHFTGLELLINIGPSNFTQSHILTS